MRRKISNGEIPPEAYYKDQVRERETYISKGLIPPNERRPNNQPIMSRPPLLPNPPMYNTSMTSGIAIETGLVLSTAIRFK